jgi:hypothetical protein
VVTPEVGRLLAVVCEDIAARYEIEFLEVGADKDHVRFLVQSIPTLSPTRIVTRVKSITAREVFRRGSAGIHLRVQRFGPSSFKIIPTFPLPPGEYAFKYGLSASASKDLYCFGIDPATEGGRGQ